MPRGSTKSPPCSTAAHSDTCLTSPANSRINSKAKNGRALTQTSDGEHAVVIHAHPASAASCWHPLLPQALHRRVRVHVRIRSTAIGTGAGPRQARGGYGASDERDGDRLGQRLVSGVGHGRAVPRLYQRHRRDQHGALPPQGGRCERMRMRYLICSDAHTYLRLTRSFSARSLLLRFL
jgi:hypothetical protein